MDKVYASLLLNDRLEITVNFADINASIVVSIDLVERVVKWGGAAIVESLFSELLIRLRLKQRRYYPIGESVIPPGIKGLDITDEFCSDMQQALSDIVNISIAKGTLKFIKR
jgi:hypothetical protein